MHTIGGRRLSLKISGLTIRDGEQLPSTQDGAGVSAFLASVHISDCVFVSNQADMGGAIGILRAQMPYGSLIERCVFINNTASNEGGAISLFQFAKLGPAWNEIRDCEFVGNSAKFDGAAILTAAENHVFVRNCVFRQNRSPEGPAISSVTGSYCVVTVCRFVANGPGPCVFVLNAACSIL